jgi:hypothetical protein
VTFPRIRLGWISIEYVQWSHFAVPSRATTVEFDRPQFRQFQVRRDEFNRSFFLAEYPRRSSATGRMAGGCRRRDRRLPT